MNLAHQLTQAAEAVPSDNASLRSAPPPTSSAVPPLTWPRVATVAEGTLPDGATLDFIGTNEALFEVQTFYERMFLSQGYKITYMAFTIDHEGTYKHPESFDSDYWRSIEGPRRFSHSPEATQR